MKIFKTISKQKSTHIKYYYENIIIKIFNTSKKNVITQKQNDNREEIENKILIDDMQTDIIVSDNNKLFLAALGNLIIDNRSLIESMDTQYVISDKNSHMIHYILPEKNLINTELVHVEIVQNIDMIIIAEKLQRK